MVGVVKADFNLFGRSYLSLLKIPSDRNLSSWENCYRIDALK